MALSTVIQFYDGTSWSSVNSGFGSGYYYNRGGGTQSACISSGGRHSTNVSDTSFSWNGTSWSSNNSLTYSTGEGCGNGSTSSAMYGPGSADQDASCSYDGTCWSNNPAFPYNTQAAGVIGDGARCMLAGGGQGVPPNPRSTYWDGTSFTVASDILAGNTHLAGIGTLGKGGGIVGSLFFEGLESPSVKFIGV